MQALLSFDRAPPFAAPLRFFLTAPLFAMLAGVLVMVAGSDVLSSRWMPGALAATHLVVVGFMLQVMVGALIQILPVVAGANLARPLAIAHLVHGGLTMGVLVLAAAFLTAMPALFITAVSLLGGAIGVFLLAAGHALLGIPSTSPTIRGLKLALLGLLAVATLGGVLALALSRGWGIDLPVVADLHAAWGLGGWGGILLVAMAYVVVPMFQLTPPYPARESWWFPPLVAGFLALWSLGVSLGSDSLLRLSEAAVALAGAGFAAFTLRLQRQRRRARVDATFLYWQMGLACGLIAMAMLLAVAIRPDLARWSFWTPLFGIVLGVGGFMSLIVGMLYKIVPFLAWLHLQNAGQGKVTAPSANKVLADKPMLWQMRAHSVALGLLVGAAFFPGVLARPAGLAFALASGWLAFNLFSAFRFYHQQTVEIAIKVGA